MQVCTGVHVKFYYTPNSDIKLSCTFGKGQMNAGRVELISVNHYRRVNLLITMETSPRHIWPNMRNLPLYLRRREDERDHDISRWHKTVCKTKCVQVKQTNLKEILSFTNTSLYNILHDIINDTLYNSGTYILISEDTDCEITSLLVIYTAGKSCLNDVIIIRRKLNTIYYLIIAPVLSRHEITQR